MAAWTDLEYFPQPDNPSVKLWRYTDFTKFVATLERESLFFPRADRLSDPFEGSLSRFDAGLGMRISETRGVPYAEVAKVRKWWREWVYISCWHANEHESAAMWKLYAKSNDAIAVQTTYEKLARCLPDDPPILVGRVVYLDYERETFQTYHPLCPFVHKRKSFEHEHEVRAILPVWDPEKDPNLTMRNGELGRNVPVDLTALVESVHVAPEAESWFKELVVRVCRKYENKWQVNSSSLDDTPLY